MIHRLPILVLTAFSTIGGFSASASAQGRRLKDEDVRKLMEEARKNVERFTDAVDSQYRRSTIRTATSEVSIDGYLRDLKKSASAMRDRFKDDYSSGNEVLSFLRQASAIEKRAASGNPLYGAEREWPRLRGALGRLSQAYGVDWNTDPELWAARRMNDRELEETFEKLKNGVKSFEKSLDSALEHVNGIASADRKAVMSAVDRLARSADDLKDAAEDGKDASGELGRLRAANEEIQAFLDKHRLASAVGSTYRLLSTDVSTITAQFR